MNLSEEQGGMAQVLLPTDLMIQQVAVVKDDLLQAMARQDQLILDCSAVASVDIAGLQLLCAAHQTAVAAGKILRLAERRSAAFDKGVQESGYARAKGCHRANPADGCLWVLGGDHE